MTKLRNQSAVLTPREVNCLSLAAQDKSLMATAETMHVAPDTVKKYRKMIMKKLGCHTMVGALGLAMKNNLLTDQTPFSKHA